MSIKRLTVFENQSNGIRFIIIIKYNMRRMWCGFWVLPTTWCNYGTFNEVLELALPPVKNASHLVSEAIIPPRRVSLQMSLDLKMRANSPGKLPALPTTAFYFFFFLITSSHLSFPRRSGKKRRRRKRNRRRIKKGGNLQIKKNHFISVVYAT